MWFILLLRMSKLASYFACYHFDQVEETDKTQYSLDENQHNHTKLMIICYLIDLLNSAELTKNIKEPKSRSSASHEMCKI